MSKEINEVIEGIRTHLKYQKEAGVDFMPKANTRRKAQGVGLKGLDEIRADLGDCKRCKLHKTRTNIVFGVGDPKAKSMFVGEGPGADEDAKSEPFVGRAGQLLTKIIQAMGLERKDVYIGNCVKCRPPENRNPEADELEKCMPFLKEQIAAVKPEVIITLGAVATKALLNEEIPISKVRGKILDWNGIKLIPTFHPAYLLRNPPAKKEVWEDIQVAMKVLGLKVKEKLAGA